MSQQIVSVSIDGVSGILDILEDAGPRHSRNLMRATIHGVAGQVRDKARINASEFADTGTTKKAIFTKRKKSPPTKPVSEVRVSHGSDQKHDAFYWHFHEYGTSTGTSEKRFVGRASEEVNANFTRILIEEFGKKLEKALAAEARRNAR